MEQAEKTSDTVISNNNMNDSFMSTSNTFDNDSNPLRKLMSMVRLCDI